MKSLIVFFVMVMATGAFAESRWTGADVDNITESTSDLEYILAKDAVQRISNVTGLRVVVEVGWIDSKGFNTTLRPHIKRTVAEEVRVLVETFFLYGLTFEKENGYLVVRARTPQFNGAARKRNPKYEEDLQARVTRTSGKVDFENAPMSCVVAVLADMTDSFIIKVPFSCNEGVTFKSDACTVREFCNMLYDHGLVVDKVSDRIFTLREWRVNEFGRTAIEQECYERFLSQKNCPQKVSSDRVDQQISKRIIVEPHRDRSAVVKCGREDPRSDALRDEQRRKAASVLEEVKRIREAKAAQRK